MEKKEDPNCISAEVDNNNTPKDEIHELLQTLEQQTNWDGRPLVKYDGFWLTALWMCSSQAAISRLENKIGKDACHLNWMRLSTGFVKKIAEFMGYPFTEEEEKQGLIDEIAKLCSFENLKNLEVNKNGDIRGVLKNSSFFRKGKVGDWTNYLTPDMAERIKKIMESKFGGCGLIFKI
ncbi:hypothetical protein DH2020_049374 [Rehmannia glutinosa]|uniref:Sulfotransferase n=1 Tax=Rehmannia glutinosa TaxID=99300 RepID=A0ABR0U324_REHGL